MLIIIGVGGQVGRVWGNCPAPDAQASTITFAVTDTDFERALRALGEQAQASLLYMSTHVFHGETVHTVVGTMTLCTALTHLLEGTGFAFDLVAPKRAFIRWVGRANDGQTQQNGEAGPQVVRVSNSQADQTVVLIDGEVTVTGSHIRGVQDISSPLVIIPQRDLETAPYADVADVMRRMPFSFAGGANQFTDPQGQLGSIANQVGGQSLNLHGLGAGATLVLVDGYRRPMSGFDGDFVDVSKIPVTAVKQIETLADGASANYGSDAIAGVVNILMNKDVEGAQTQFRVSTNPGGAWETLFAQSLGIHWDGGHAVLAYQFSDLRALPAQARFYTASSDKTPLGGSNFSSIRSDPGNILDPSTLQPKYAIPANPTGALLTASQLIPNTVNLQNRLTDIELTPSRHSNSVFWSAEQSLTDIIEVFTEGLLAQQSASVKNTAADAILVVPPGNPFNPLPEMPETLVAYSFQNDLGPVISVAQTTSFSGLVGAKVHLPHGWLATLSTSSARERTTLHTDNLVSPSALATAVSDTNPQTS
ncbi:MAG TPA: TonB-dependent receptor plug domain-containing protein, partial [Steroidobacteraceae bacterium]